MRASRMRCICSNYARCSSCGRLLFEKPRWLSAFVARGITDVGFRSTGTNGQWIQLIQLEVLSTESATTVERPVRDGTAREQRASEFLIREFKKSVAAESG